MLEGCNTVCPMRVRVRHEGEGGQHGRCERVKGVVSPRPREVAGGPGFFAGVLEEVQVSGSAQLLKISQRKGGFLSD